MQTWLIIHDCNYIVFISNTFICNLCQGQGLYKIMWTHPFHIFTKCLTVAGSENLKLDMRIRAFSAEVHHPRQSTDASL